MIRTGPGPKTAMTVGSGRELQCAFGEEKASAEPAWLGCGPYKRLLSRRNFSKFQAISLGRSGDQKAQDFHMDPHGKDAVLS